MEIPCESIYTECEPTGPIMIYLLIFYNSIGLGLIKQNKMRIIPIKA